MKITVRKKLEKINISGKIRENVPMADYTTFRTGGIADLFVTPGNVDDLRKLLDFIKNQNLPFFILGGGANIVVSDRGIRGIVMNLQELKKISFNNSICTAEAGFTISRLAEITAEKGLAGLDFIYGMPGTIGGAVWMNARCYGVSISDIMTEVIYLDNSLNMKSMDTDIISNNFSYKKSPFQDSDMVILSASFKLKNEDKKKIWNRMNRNRGDREKKGHYKYPSAGSVFKNNRSFGMPTGAIIDSLGLKGFTLGGAQVADYHGNIIVNRKDAKSSDIRGIVEYIRKTVFEKLGFLLEPEIQFVGDWDAGESI